jgi:hypothetical protein
MREPLFNSKEQPLELKVEQYDVKHKMELAHIDKATSNPNQYFHDYYEAYYNIVDDIEMISPKAEELLSNLMHESFPYYAVVLKFHDRVLSS